MKKILLLVMFALALAWGTVLKPVTLHIRVWLLRLDEHGDTLWTRLYGDDGTLYVPTFVGETSDGGYIIAGGYDDWVEEDYFWLMKIDSALELDWENTYPIPNAPPDTIVHKDGDTNIVERIYPPRCVVETESGGFIVEGDRRYNEERTESRPVWFVEVSSTGKWLSCNNDSLLTQPLSKGNPYKGYRYAYPIGGSTEKDDEVLNLELEYDEADSSQYCRNCFSIVKYKWIGGDRVEMSRHTYSLWDQGHAEFINCTSGGGFLVVAWVERWQGNR